MVGGALGWLIELLTGWLVDGRLVVACWFLGWPVILGLDCWFVAWVLCLQAGCLPEALLLKYVSLLYSKMQFLSIRSCHILLF
jgi:predicted lysophospholipase L1 biosynthesis ABC-type transport system permease subunit